MRKMFKWAMGAAMTAGMALAAAAPAQAGVTIGVGVPIAPVGPARGPNWCYYHPGACGPAYVAGPVVGVFVPGRGYWDGRAWYWHRYWRYGRWYYR